MRVCVVIPAYQVERTVGSVVQGASEHSETVIVVDDGSTDATAEVAMKSGALLVRHGRNLGKGEALTSGLGRARALGYSVAVSLDADGQHDPAEIPSLAAWPDAGALVVGVRDLSGAGAPGANIFSNAISNLFLSLFAGQKLPDTQCGFRRYPVVRTLGLGLRGWGYEWEAEVLLRAVRAGVPVVSVPIRVRYPQDRLTFFRPSRDVRRIISRVLRTELE